MEEANLRAWAGSAGKEQQKKAWAGGRQLGADPAELVRLGVGRERDLGHS